MTSCVSDFGYSAAGVLQAKSIVVKATVDSAIQVAIALWERNSSLSIANMQDELADRQTVLAEQVHAHAKQFWPAETSLVNDVFGAAKVTTSYSALANGWGQMADIETDAGRSDWIARMSARCTPASRCEDARWQRNAQAARADIMSYACRQDEARTQITNDRRYARQYAVLGLGKGQLRDLLSYQAIGNIIGTNASEALIGTVNSALTTYGFYSNRLNTQQWGAGIREAWTQSYATAPMGEVKRADISMVPVPEQVKLAPVAPELLKQPAKGKAAEWNDLSSDLQKMEDRSGRY